MSNQAPDEILLIVHGVGDPVPGETIDNVARSLVTEEGGVVEQREKIWLRELDIPSFRDRGRYTKTFATNVRHFQANGHSATAAEIFWGDLSRVRRGIFGVIVGVCQIIFGLRYVAYVAADQPGIAARGLRLLGLHSARLLHGPVLAVNFILAMLTLILVGTEQLWHKSYLHEMWADTLIICASLFLLCLSATVWRASQNRIIERFWFWVFVGALFLGVLVGVKALSTGGEHQHVYEGEHSHLSCGLFWYCRIFFVLLEMQYIWIAFVLFSMTVCWIGALCHPKTNRQGLHVGYLLPILLVGLWTLVLPLVWVMGGEGLKKIVDAGRYDWLFHEAVPLLSIQILASLLLSVVAVLVLIWYGVWRTRNRVDNYFQGRRSPRLILNPVLQFCVGLCALLGVSVSLIMAWLQFDGSSYEKYALGLFLIEANKYAIGLLIPVMGLLLLSLKYLRPALDIVLDVVNHFYLRPVNPDDHTLDDDDEFDLIQVSNETGTMDFPIRELIVGRLRKVLEHFAKSDGPKPILNIVAHSQGTVIAVEALNHEEMGWLTDRFSEINLVTMGSPLGHLYQFYFPHVYPPMDQPFWSDLRSRVDRWINIFRIDDYVGTEISFPDSIAESRGPKCTNHPVHVAGHGMYWMDKQVLSIIGTEELSPLISSVFGESLGNDDPIVSIDDSDQFNRSRAA